MLRAMDDVYVFGLLNSPIFVVVAAAAVRSNVFAALGTPYIDSHEFRMFECHSAYASICYPAFTIKKQ